ncbi:DUF305 domain-containing protein [Euzebya rosea]|uniref:DUF305 domain-containing protein n=1 Tax=Euzebya rosea TaxID=2052804 RepID=UPI000D3E987D|nr:DUF305 domain-containing protein [Euzebya rosea]
MSYGRFFAMIATSTAIMYGLTYLNSSDIVGHARFSETRLFMSLLMGATMTAVMLGFMLNMYRKTTVNIAIALGAVVVFASALFLARSQTTVDDTSYMKAMIPHHSIAILTSSRAGIEDLRVRELADEIIAAQEREIGEMNWLIEDIATNGPADTRDEALARPVPEF